MKRINIALVATALSFSLVTGCSVQVEDTEKVATGKAPTYTLSQVVIPTECPYFSGSYNKLTITDEHHEELKAAVDEWFTTYEQDSLATAEHFEEEAYELNSESEAPSDDEYSFDFNYNLTGSVDVKRCDDQVFSILVSDYMYMAGAHGNTIYTGVTFDSKTGQILQMSDFGDLNPVFEEYVIKTINESDELKSGLFPEYSETIHSSFSDQPDYPCTTFWLDNRGVTVAFQEYAIAPYAAGIVSFTLPYSTFKDFKSSYIPKDSSYYSAQLSYFGYPEMMSLFGDGSTQNVWLEKEVDDENMECTATLHIDDFTYKVDFDEYYTADAYIIHRDNENYALIDTIGFSDYHETALLGISKDGIKEIQILPGSVSSLEEKRLSLIERIDVFGTWTGDRYYSYSSEGLTCLDETYYLNNVPSKYSYARSLKLKSLINVTYISNGTESAGMLHIGDEIYPIEINDNKMTFVMKDGTMGYFIYEYSEEEGFSADGVNQLDLFEELPYAA